MPPREAIKLNELLPIEAAGVEWIQAAEADSDKPKTFRMKAYTGGAMRVSLYYSPVVIDLAGLTAAADEIPILLGHNPSQIVGHGSADIAAKQVTISGVISGGGAAAEEVRVSAKNSFPWKASIGVVPFKVEYIDEGATGKANGQAFKGPVNIVRGGVLQETSFVPIAADPKTSVKVAATATDQPKEKPMDPQFREWLQAKGFDPETISEAQQGTLQAAYDAEQKPATPPTPPVEAAGQDNRPDPVAEMRRQAAAESTRIAAVRAACAGRHAAIEAKAIADGWDETRTQLEVLRAERSTGPAIHAHDAPKLEAPVIEAALCMQGGLKGVEKQYPEPVLEAAGKHRGLGLQDVIMITARANGYAGPSVRIRSGNIESVMRHAFAPVQATFSTVSLPGVFSNVANKFLLEGFMDVEQVWREFAAIATANDFKTMTHYRMLDDMAFEEVGPAGEMKHGELSEESYTNVVKTYGKMLGLTRQDIINDDLGAFDNIRERIGRGGGLKLNRVFWLAFLTNSTFFTSARGNVITNVLGEAGITAAELALASMTDGSDNPIDVGGPHIMLVPPALDPTARKWYVSQEIRDTTASTKTPTTNIYLNKYRPVMSRYITTGYGGAATQWFLVPAGGGEMAPMEVAFLDGNQTPIVESAEADFNTLGVQFRGYWDFGCAQKEWRASVKSAGTG